MINDVFPEINGNFAFGCMRLPMNGEKVDLEQFNQMIDYYIYRGFNYFDTAHGYLNGESEKALAKTLVKRYKRDEYLLANKLSNWYFEEEKEIIPLFEKQLKLCGNLDYFDFYLMHAQDKKIYEKYKRTNAYKTTLRLKDQGKIKHFGISFHDSADVLDEILSDWPQIEFVQIQFNYLDFDDKHIQSGALYEVCNKHNKPVFVMEPVKGGKLAMMPDSTRQILTKLNERQDTNYSPSAYALRYCMGFTNNCLILSGVSNLEQMKENCRVFTESKGLNPDEVDAIKLVKQEFEKLKNIDCTGCSYCVNENKCPKKVPIPQIFSCYNESYIFKNWDAKEYYKQVLVRNAGACASDCIECKECINVCPQHLDIPSLLKKAAKEFE